MSTDLSFGIATLFFVAYYLIVMRIGLRTGKGRKWPLGSEATLTGGILLIAQWISLAIWIWNLSEEREKITVARTAIPVLFGIPAILLLLWGWIYLKINDSSR